VKRRDLEFERRAIIVHDGKGAQDRVTVLPDSLIPLLFNDNYNYPLMTIRNPQLGAPKASLWAGLRV